MQLSVVENKALMADTTINILLVSMNFGMYLAGVFGMNLDQATRMYHFGFQYWRGGFPLVFVLSFAMIGIVFYSILLRFIWTKVFPVLVKPKLS